MKKFKKVAIFIDGEFIPSFSGASNRFQYLSRALQEHTNTEIVIILCDRGWSDIKQIKKESFTTYVVHPGLFKNIDFLTNILKGESVNIIQFANLELAVEIGIPLSNNLKKHLIFESHYGDYEFAKSVDASQNALDKIIFLQNAFGKYFDKVIALSSEDPELSRNLKLKRSDISIIPSGVDLAEFPDNCFNGSSKKIIFLGNLFFAVNLKAVKNIKQTIYKGLKDLDYKFSIIGDISPREKDKLEDKKFIVTGKKTDLSQSFNKATVALAPVFSGSGIRIKILNYLNAGIPVVTTSQGARGFDRKYLVVVEDDLDKYPSLIEELVKEKEKLIHLSERGREFVREKMSWERISRLVSKEYDKLLKEPAISKRQALKQISKLTFENPAWIKKVIKDKRFKRNIPYVGIDSYKVINNKSKIVIALEGLPCAGKSTFFNKFKKDHADFFCVSELYIAAKNNDSSVTMRERYANAEILKKSGIDHVNRDSLLDRSFLSTLAFSYAKYKTTGDSDDYIFNKKFLEDHKQDIIIPDFVFVFTITPEESVKRRKKLVRDDTLDFWRNGAFLRSFLAFYHLEDFTKIIPKNRVTFIDTMKMDRQETYKFIVDTIKGRISMP